MNRLALTEATLLRAWSAELQLAEQAANHALRLEPRNPDYLDTSRTDHVSRLAIMLKDLFQTQGLLTLGEERPMWPLRVSLERVSATPSLERALVVTGHETLYPHGVTACVIVRQGGEVLALAWVRVAAGQTIGTQRIKLNKASGGEFLKSLPDDARLEVALMDTQRVAKDSSEQTDAVTVHLDVFSPRSIHELY